jgi:hypothetical protein
MVWLGRVRNLAASQRAKIPIEAKKHVGKPYDFWDFDLNDDILGSIAPNLLGWLSSDPVLANLAG